MSAQARRVSERRPQTHHDVGLLGLDLGEQWDELLRQARLVEHLDEVAEDVKRANLGREDARLGEEDLRARAGRVSQCARATSRVAPDRR